MAMLNNQRVYPIESTYPSNLDSHHVMVKLQLWRWLNPRIEGLVHVFFLASITLMLFLKALREPSFEVDSIIRFEISEPARWDVWDFVS